MARVYAKKNVSADTFVLPIKMLILVPVYSWHLAVSKVLSCCFID